MDFFMPYRQNTFCIRSASEGMINIFRLGSNQRLHAERDQEIKLLEVICIYTAQFRFASRILCDHGIEEFIKSYNRYYEVMCLKWNSCGFDNISIPNIGTEPLIEDVPYISICNLSSMNYLPRMRCRDLIFTYNGEVFDNSLVINNLDIDNLIIALFNAASQVVGIRATVCSLSKTLDLEYLKIRERMQN